MNGEKYQVGAIGWWLLCLGCALVAAMAMLAIGSLAVGAVVGIAHLFGGPA